MTHDINSRARQLLVDIGLKEPKGDPPEIVAQYERLVAFVADELRHVASEARETTNPCNKIFDHKWLSPECVETGCQSLLLTRRAERAEEVADKYKWQVRDTCARAEKAEAALASLRALLAEAGKTMRAYEKWEADLIINGDWSRGCVLMNQAQHDRMLELQSLRVRIVAAIQSALREIPTFDAKPLDFP